MTRHFSPIIWLALVLLLVPFPASALTDDAEAPDGNPTGGNRHRWSDRTAVAATLVAPDDGAAWGRVMYFTHEYPYGIMTELKCHVVDLEPLEEYTLVFYDAEGVGVEVGTIETDDFGEGWLKLQNRVADDGETSIRNYDPIPEGVHGVLEVKTAMVFFAGVEDGDPVLTGSFVELPEAPSGAVQPVYLERIRLHPDPLGDLPNARGIARVVIDVDGYQYFSTSASGLEPNSVYRIEVGPGNELVGTVSTNPCGHAELELSDHPGIEDHLPDALQVNEMTTVEWFDADEKDTDAVLWGTFTGTNMVDVAQATGGVRRWTNRRGCDDEGCGGAGGDHGGGCDGEDCDGGGGSDDHGGGNDDHGGGNDDHGGGSGGGGDHGGN